MKKRIVITGIGVLASNGEGREAYWNSLKKGMRGYKPVTLFDTAPYSVHEAGEISDFNAKLYLGPKGLRSLDRSTKLLITAAKLAIDDARLIITEENTDDIGVAVGTTLGSIKSISDFDQVTLKEGPRYTNPALFPNTVLNSPASHISIWHNIKGFNTTISSGFTASLDALVYAYDFIQLDRVKLVFAGGVEEMCLQTFLGFYALKFLSGSKAGESFINCPFDKRRNGITFGEGACLIALEEYQYALKRKANILGEVLAFGYGFVPYRVNKYHPKGLPIKLAIEQALDKAQLNITDIDYICSNANSSIIADRSETYAIKSVFGKQSYKIPISSIKSMVGECFSVSGALAVAGGLAALKENFIPPTVNYSEKDPECDLDYVPNIFRSARLKHVLIINFSPNGSAVCVIIRKVK